MNIMIGVYSASSLHTGRLMIIYFYTTECIEYKMSIML